MPKKVNKILDKLSEILEEKNLKPEDKISSLKQFDSIMILQIINLSKMVYEKQIDGLQLLKCKKIIDIINLIEKK